MKKIKLIWSIFRTIGFVLVGLMNTLFLRVEDVGSWKNYVGYAFLIIAAIDIIGILISYRKM